MIVSIPELIRDLQGDRYNQEVIDEIVKSVKLLELINERLEGTSKSAHKKFSDEIGYLEQELQSLMDEAEK